MQYCYLNGKIIPLSKAALSPKDLGILRGYGVFDFLRTYNGKPFLLKEHLARFKNSARILNLKIPISQEKLEAVIKKLIKKNKFKESNTRIVLTGGPAEDGLTYNPKNTTLYILNWPYHAPPPSFYTKGVKLITHEYQRQTPRAKVLNYAPAIALQEKKKKASAVETLYTQGSDLLEAAMSNFFIFKKDTLITPKDNILFGTTRNFTIKIARGHFKIEQKRVLKKELNFATEAFITSTTTDILPVVRIDNKIVASGKVGKNTKFLMSLFKEYAEKN
ncbi:aminotransferase class IV [Candidatus Falkowbacteria bacterium]|nr:aminotransferase class IV [Candidatus Falkowbacteria bacterium]